MNNSERPAAPCKSNENNGAPHYKDIPHNGLTKREHFAGLAMQGLLAGTIDYEYDIQEAAEAAETSVQIADALLKELDK